MMTNEERIAKLREALIDVEYLDDVLSTGHRRIAEDALRADDVHRAPVPTVTVRTDLTTPPALRHRLDEVASAQGKPDLPLDEGSRWDEWGGITAVKDRWNRYWWLLRTEDGAVFLCHSGSASDPNLLDVLALARRGGYV